MVYTSFDEFKKTSMIYMDIELIKQKMISPCINFFVVCAGMQSNKMLWERP